MQTEHRVNHVDCENVSAWECRQKLSNTVCKNIFILNILINFQIGRIAVAEKECALIEGEPRKDKSISFSQIYVLKKHNKYTIVQNEKEATHYYKQEQNAKGIWSSVAAGTSF